MSYQNALIGIKRIYKAQIIMLISTIVTILTAIISNFVIASSAYQGRGYSSNGARNTLIVLGVFSLAYIALMIVAFILNLMGLSSAKKDETSFASAMIFAWIGIAASILYSVTGKNPLFSWIVNLCNLLTSLFIIKGIINIANKLGESQMQMKGSRLFTIMIIVWVLGVINDFLKQFSTFKGIVVFLYFILSIISYIMYLSFLSDTGKMMERNWNSEWI